MRINDAYRPTATATDTAAARPPSATGAADPSEGGAASASAAVTVTVSDKARELSTRTNEASDAKVAALQSSIANGTFKVDAQLIAKRIVGDE